MAQVYQTSVETFLPTPIKSHYLFNMRDVAKVIEGVMQVCIRMGTTTEPITRSQSKAMYVALSRAFPTLHPKYLSSDSREDENKMLSSFTALHKRERPDVRGVFLGPANRYHKQVIVPKFVPLSSAPFSRSVNPLRSATTDALFPTGKEDHS